VGGELGRGAGGAGAGRAGGAGAGRAGGGAAGAGWAATGRAGAGAGALGAGAAGAAGALGAGAAGAAGAAAAGAAADFPFELTGGDAVRVEPLPEVMDWIRSRTAAAASSGMELEGVFTDSPIPRRISSRSLLETLSSLAKSYMRTADI
jgi:hypothetical protein